MSGIIGNKIIADDVAKATIEAMLTAVEFGYRCGERGYNLQETMKLAHSSFELSDSTFDFRRETLPEDVLVVPKPNATRNFRIKK